MVQLVFNPYYFDYLNIIGNDKFVGWGKIRNYVLKEDTIAPFEGPPLERRIVVARCYELDGSIPELSGYDTREVWVEISDVEAIKMNTHIKK